MTEQQTHFGFKQVPESEKQSKVTDVFNSVTDQYDLMNDLMSFGVHRIWKRFAVSQCRIKTGDKVLDLAGGTGDLSHQFSKAVGERGKVYLADINYSMLSKGREKLLDHGIANNIEYVQANAESLAFADNSFDCICMGFGLRNVTHIDKALSSMYQVLKPGGRLIILEFSKAKAPGLNKIYDLYSFKLLPKIGKVIANDEASYQYLAESIRMHPDQEKLKDMILAAGFDDCDYNNLSGGIVAVHCAQKY